MEEVYGNSTKLVIDQNSGSNNVMYLPLDQLIRQRSSNAPMTQFDGTSGDADYSGAFADTNSNTRQERSSRLRSLTQ